MTRISLYTFVRTFCMAGLPTIDIVAFLQRWGDRILKIWLVSRLLSMLKTPFFYAGIVLLLTFFPESVMWVFLKIGEIEMRVFLMVLQSVMPDIFAAGDAPMTSWADMWANGLSVLPQDMLDIMNGLGIAQLLGLITTTIGAVGTIRIYRRVMHRACMM